MPLDFFCQFNTMHVMLLARLCARTNLHFAVTEANR